MQHKVIQCRKNLGLQKFTQSVLLFSFSSLFCIKVPDCDGIAVKHKNEKEILIIITQELVYFVSKIYNC